MNHVVAMKNDFLLILANQECNTGSNTEAFYCLTMC